MKSKMVGFVVLTAMFFYLGKVDAARAEFSPPSAFGWHQGVPLILIDCEAVQLDLGLSPQTIDSLKKLNEQIETDAQAELLKTWQGGKYKSLDDVPSDQKQHIRGWIKMNRRVIGEIQEKYQSKINDLLSHDQQDRLHQIDLQSAGIDAFVDPDFAQELKMNSQQKRNIVQVYWALHKQQVKPSKSVVKPFNEQIFDVLTTEQKETFEKLKGKPLDPINEAISAKLQSFRRNTGASKIFREFPVR